MPIENRRRPQLRAVTYEQGLQERISTVMKRKIGAMALETTSTTTIIGNLIVYGIELTNNSATGVGLSIAGAIASGIIAYKADKARAWRKEDEITIKKEAYYRWYNIIGKVRPKLERREVIFQNPNKQDTF